MVLLYQEIGGRGAIESLVDLLYLKVLTDTRISHFFEGLDMERQIAKQQAFLLMAFGSDEGYSGKDLRSAHAHLVEQGLNDSHFDAFVEDFIEVFKEINPSPEVLERVQRTIEGKRDEVLNR